MLMMTLCNILDITTINADLCKSAFIGKHLEIIVVLLHLVLHHQALCSRLLYVTDVLTQPFRCSELTQKLIALVHINFHYKSECEPKRPGSKSMECVLACWALF